VIDTHHIHNPTVLKFTFKKSILGSNMSETKEEKRGGVYKEGKPYDHTFVSVMNAIAFNQTDDYIEDEDSSFDVNETLVALPIQAKSEMIEDDREDRKETHRDVHQWLADIDLGFLAGPLISEGYDTMSRLAALEIEDLLEMGVKKGYARSLLSSLRKDTDQMYKDVEIEVQNLKGAMDSVMEARRNCKDSKNRIQIRRKSVRTRIMSFFQSLHEILEQRENDLLQDLDECVNEKVRALSAQQNVLKHASSDLTENLKIAKKTLNEALPQEFSMVSLPMLTKLRRMASLNWIDAPLKPLEDGSDMSLYITSSPQQDNNNKEENDDDEGIPFIVRELKRTGRILNLSPRCCTLESQDGTDISSASPIVVTAGIPHHLVLTARDRTGMQLPHGGAIVTIQIFENTCKIESTQQEQLTVVEHVHRVVDRKNGKYDIELTIPSGSRGNFTVFCVINGGNVQGSPVRVACESNVLLAPLLLKNDEDDNKNNLFNSNGLFCFLGTRKGTSEYVNPCDAHEVSVEVSSLFNGQASSVVSSNFSDTYSKDEHGSWYCVDIGPGRSLAPSHYALRNVSRSYFHAPRNWRLEASKDTKNWILLSEHLNDMSIDTKTNAFATFELSPDVQKDSYRYFCITQTGPNAFGKHVLVMGGFELYGALLSSSSSRSSDDSSTNRTPNSFSRTNKKKKKSSRKTVSSSSKKKKTRPRWNNKFVDVPKIRRCPRVGQWVRHKGAVHAPSSQGTGARALLSGGD